MILREFIYFNDREGTMQDSDRYDPSHDTSILKANDTQKVRLTLGMLNSLRKSSDAREFEQQEELELVRQMYAAPKPEAGGII